jgi:hypothetical protein
MTVKQATAGAGFDCNTPLNGAQAATFKAQGMEFVVRYVPRTPALIPGNLTAAEIEIILSAGMALMAVQHVSPDNWMPTAAIGLQYGQYAGAYAKAIGLAAGVNIFLDLEMVSTTATAAATIAYCHAWFNEVQAAGYVPGLYVGWQTGLSSQQLHDLPFLHYWRGYNADIAVAERGYQILQHPQLTMSGVEYDPNTIQADALGGLPVWLSPE